MQKNTPKCYKQNTLQSIMTWNFYKSIGKALGLFLIFCVLFSARVVGTVSPFAIAFLFSLVNYNLSVFVKLLVFVLAAVSILGGGIANIIIITNISVGFLVLVLFRKHLKAPKWFKYIPFVFASQAALVFISYSVSFEYFIKTVTGVVISLIFFVVFFLFSTAVKNRRFKTKFTIDEMLGAAGLIGALSLGLYGTQVFG
ncbi:MAG: hypothetical protein FWD32_02020, partial [Firmicutes bacterium]|nr:hypothetical protein [Bacillota bacterium]